ncbi:teichoic acids export ABC transporter ATP-binding subunit TagH [Neobacillus sp. CF12]|uniref:teichoic acids export ABC transporter ATP-binding subunit TagH n=1 Tax=Neobacillus sp. CF12 TaxID=3055864 RepID=UPI0025A14030|nr:teichoic acids export ABC transporter ATP-binding subunit TagH [Neobacillus sp. CF12]MDM5329825.1 teichoic acids export ABC transporter ATP-binding subunit TagH [Neobacillus sp. CF12]
MSASVVLKNVTKKYKMYKKTSDKLLDLALPSGYGKDFYALQNINFEAQKGDIIGIIGVNGAGKSTISNLISGVIPPTSGSVKINGDAALISIGAGLNNELSGRENIELKCLMLGFKKQEIESLMPEIIDFADIGEFIDQPVKKYSSGMKSRLGFAISVNIDPDILVIDEALSVGDKIFAQKCLDKMNSFKERGKTIFFISHSISQVKEFCHKALWLEAGEIRAYGPIEEVVPQYEKFIQEYNKMSKEEKKQFNRQVMEKRSVLQHAPIPTDKSMGPSRTEKARKKPKKKFKLNIFRSFLVLVLFVTAGALYGNWNHINSFFEPEEKVSVAKQEEEQPVKAPPVEPVEETTVPEKDLRYVHIEAGFVRDAPNLSTSTKITMMYFGDPIIVEETLKDPEGDFQWLKFKLPSGQDAWISENLVTKVGTPIDEEKFMASIEELIELDGLSESLGVMGKSLQEITEAEQLDDMEIVYDGNNKANQLQFNLGGIAEESLFALVGEPTLQHEENTYLYHGKNYDLVLTSQNGAFTSLTVKQVVQENNNL